jgi:hypothetical protein
MKLFGQANWWMPDWARVVLRLPEPAVAAPTIVDVRDAVPHQRDARAARPKAKT